MAYPKVFSMNDCDWWAGYDLESTVAAYNEHVLDEDLVDEPEELRPEDLDRLIMQLEPEDKNGPTMSFRLYLDSLVNEGQEFPCFFASTEY